MGEERLWHLVSYDIRDPARWRKAYRLLKGYGRRLQYSVFRVRGTKLQVERLRWELEMILEPEDDLVVIPLCGRCSQRVAARNPKQAWPEDEPPFKIIS